MVKTNWVFCLSNLNNRTDEGMSVYRGYVTTGTTLLAFQHVNVITNK